MSDVRFFYMPGCSSCQRTKEFLTAQGVAFEPVNVIERPDGREFLAGIGINMVPALSRGGRGTEAVQLDRVAAFLDLDYRPPAKLSPDELYFRYRDIITIASGLVRDMPEEHLWFHFPERPRTFIGLTYHVFHIAEAFLHGYRTGTLPFSFMEAKRPRHLNSGEAMAGHGAEVLAGLDRWWEDEGQFDPFLREVDTYYGRVVLHACFERSVWHSTQHVRQLEMFLKHLDAPITRPLTPADLDGLPLPEGIWLAAD